jgi:cadmium resistance protein CadD (predicted permease)
VLDILRAVGLFAVTNADDIVLPALFFARGVPAWRVVLANGGDNIGPSTSRSSPPPGSPDT